MRDDFLTRFLVEFVVRATVWLIERIGSSPFVDDVVHSIYARLERRGAIVAMQSAFASLPHAALSRVRERFAMFSIAAPDALDDEGAPLLFFTILYVARIVVMLMFLQVQALYMHGPLRLQEGLTIAIGVWLFIIIKGWSRLSLAVALAAVVYFHSKYGTPNWLAIVLAVATAAAAFISIGWVIRELCVRIAETRGVRSEIAIVCLAFWSIELLRFWIIAGTQGTIWIRLLGEVAATLLAAYLVAWRLYRYADHQGRRYPELYQKPSDALLREVDRAQARNGRAARRRL